jgi:phage baseplate assembly protein gpV
MFGKKAAKSCSVNHEAKFELAKAQDPGVAGEVDEGVVTTTLVVEADAIVVEADALVVEADALVVTGTAVVTAVAVVAGAPEQSQ